MARLPSGGFATYDGQDVVEVDPISGAQVRILFTPPGAPFGSFLCLDPSTSELLFGENTGGWIWGIDLQTSTPRRIANLPYNFDAAFDPSGRLFVSANTHYVFGHQSPNEIWYVDSISGSADLVAAIDGPSGPLAFLPTGDLLYVPQPWTFPVPQGSLELLRFGAAQVTGALGPTHLTSANGVREATGISGAYGLVACGDGTVWTSDPTRGEIQRIANGSTELVFEGHAEDQFTSLVFESATVLPFQSYGPFEAGTLYGLATDWRMSHHVVAFRPEPVRLRATTPNPIPRAAFGFVLDRGPANGAYLLAVATRTRPTYVLDLGLPIALDLELAALVTLLPALGLDPYGNAFLPLDASNAPSGTSLAWQALALDDLGWLVGSTNLLTVIVQ